jgi:group I intron endonuclease
MQIYKITNKINNKIYIGKDTTNDSNYYGSGVLITKSIKKHGIENFTKEILEVCDTNNILCEREKYWISFFNSCDLQIGYNISKGGDGGDTLSNHPNINEIKEKISESMKKRTFSEEHKNNLSKNHTSTKHRKGKTFEEIYGKEFAENYKTKLKESRRKYKTEKERLGENYEKVTSISRLKFQGENNPMKRNRYLWYYNPKNGVVTRIIEGNEIPDGFIKGRKFKDGNR